MLEIPILMDTQNNPPKKPSHPRQAFLYQYSQNAGDRRYTVVKKACRDICKNTRKIYEMNKRKTKIVTKWSRDQEMKLVKRRCVIWERREKKMVKSV
jgi:hypothetical protein